MSLMARSVGAVAGVISPVRGSARRSGRAPELWWESAAVPASVGSVAVDTVGAGTVAERSAEPMPASADAPLHALLDAPPGPEAARGLAALDPADLDDLSLVEALAAWERLAAWAQAGSARMLAESLERTRGSSRHEFVVDEVAARLGLSRAAAEQHVTVAHGAHALPEVADALAEGAVDRRKAEALVATGRLPDDRRREVVRELRPELEHLTVRQIRDRLRRAEIAADPEGAAERHESARRARHVTLEPVDDAMAYLTAYLPADDAARAFARIDDQARRARSGAGEARGLGECRADAMVGLLTGTAGSTDSTDVPDDARGRAVPSSPVVPGGAPGTARVHVTVAASTLLGTDDLPAILAGHGPIPAAMARTLATDPDAVWQRILTDPVTGVLTDTSSRSYRPGRALRAAVVARDATCRFPGCQVPARYADLDHIEPFDPADDRAQTTGDNLHVLCRTHHRAKTVGGWDVVRDPHSGVTTWTSPSGRRYRRSPHPADPAAGSRADPGPDPPARC